MYVICIFLILRGYDDFENNRMRFISNNTEENTDKEIEPVGVFTTMDKTFEPSVEQLLQQEFGSIDEINTTPTSTVYVEPNGQLTLDNFENKSATIFQPQPEVQASLPGVQQEKVIKRKKLITDIFKTVQTKVIYWFENIDDQPIDRH